MTDATFASAATTCSVDAPVDAVILLAGDPEGRTPSAYELYRRGFTKQIAIGKSHLDTAASFGLSLPTTELMHRALIKLGVPDDAITFFGKDLRNTYQEAKAGALWAKSNDIHSVAIVTEWVTARRVRWIFEKEMKPLGIEVKIQLTQEDADHAQDNWWRNEWGIVTFQNEILKYLYYRFKY
jgi:uncharacterized SAM-binding protein YcdF (DUF218 family)